jgi:hypothetical protein
MGYSVNASVAIMARNKPVMAVKNKIVTVRNTAVNARLIESIRLYMVIYL